MNWEDPNDLQNIHRITPNWEIRQSLYQWFQVPSGQALRRLRYSPWGGILPVQTGGSGLFRTENSCVQALAFDLYKEEKELQLPSVPSQIPCLIHPNTGHASWVKYKCVSCGKNWYCSSHNRRSYCRRCQVPNRSPVQGELEGTEIISLLCGWELLVPVAWEIPEEQWETTVKECQKRFAWKLVKRK